VSRVTKAAGIRPAIMPYVLLVWPLTVAQLSIALVAPYYAIEFGLPLAFVGFILTLARILDVVADVAVAWGSDQTRTRWGRRKPWVVIGMLIYVPATVLLFVPPSAVSRTRFVLVTVAFFLAWTAAFVPYLTQGTELTRDYHVKNRINLSVSATMLTSILLAFSMPFFMFDPRAAFLRRFAAIALHGAWPSVAALLLQPGPTGAAYYGHSMLVITLLALAPVIIILPLYVMRVHEMPLAKGVAKGSITAALRNRLYMRFSLGYIFMMIAHMGRTGLTPFVLVYALHLPDSYFFYMILLFLTSLLVTPVWSWLLAWFERKTCLILAAATECMGLAMLFAIPPNSPFLAAAAFIMIGLCGQTLLMVPYLIAADCSDYAQWKTGADSRAMHLSFCSLITKLGTTYAGFSVWIVGLAGFNPALAQQPDHVITLIKIVGLAVPSACLIIGSLIILRFPLNQRRHSAVRNRLDRRAALGDAIVLSP